ncbi:MAG: hypothetical protein AVDCRST_MAG61-2401 [uncultured Friedmanniella sp.]|uniref:Uncharacterized protein n=1 Tax=uncultured Friedmanniella sp. TaxID=335381 RepID=A0A6J4L660_9ACTN|nr:MAG: hypothetical protein AVDCRST_MAG61-2401 [uncultured Friedmanniella sp.]
MVVWHLGGGTQKLLSLLPSVAPDLGLGRGRRDRAAGQTLS